MTQRRRVGISEFVVARAPALLVSYGLGSCLGIMLHDPQLQIGGLAHTLLPDVRPRIATDRPGKFVPLAIEAMRRELLAAGSEPQRLIAKICGGAHMFQPLAEDLDATIGQRNVRAARDALLGLGIPLVGEDVGGSCGRTLEFDLASGRVRVLFVRGRDRIREL